VTQLTDDGHPRLLSVEDAQARLLEGLEPLAGETVPLLVAHRRRAAADHLARRTQPPFAASAMDGYAIRWADRAGPWRIVGEAAAGRRFAGELRAGETVRISTGAPVPRGADTVVVQEDVERVGDRLQLIGAGPPAHAAHIRSAGLDFGEGDRLVARGDRLTPARLGLLAAGGHGSAFVYRRPRIALLATGDELVSPGILPGPDQIVGGNSVMIAAQLDAAGATVIDGGIVPDRPEALHAAIAALADVDLLITIGGASVGDHDLVVPVLRSLGAVVDFWKVALRPGKPVIAGRLGTTRVVGLPGNPVSAFVCAQLFVLPMIARWSGNLAPFPLHDRARLAVSLPANDPRRDYLRAILIDGRVTPAARQDSGMLRTLADANALIVRSPGAAAQGSDTQVDIVRLDSA